MGGRNHLPPHALNLREPPLGRSPHHPHRTLIEDPRHHSIPHPHHHHPPPPSSSSRPHHPALLEDRIAAQHRDIQHLLLDNQRLAATHVALKQDLAAAQQELRRLAAAADDVKAQRDAQVREVYERSQKMEAEFRSIDALNAELAQVRGDVQKLTAERRDLTSKLQSVESELARARSELQQFPAIKAEIEIMQQEIQRGRAAIEYEKKTQALNLDQAQAMEKNMVTMAREIEKLRAELANAEKRARAAAAAAAAASPSPGYAAGYGIAEVGYAGSTYPDQYAMRHVHGGPDAGQQYGPGAGGPHGPYDMQRNHISRS